MRTLPPLPDADYWSTRDDDTALYTADQMRAYALQVLEIAAQEIREACAYEDWNEAGRFAAELLVPPRAPSTPQPPAPPTINP